LVTLTGPHCKIRAADLAILAAQVLALSIMCSQLSSLLRRAKLGQSIALMKSTTLLKSPAHSLSLHMDGASPMPWLAWVALLQKLPGGLVWMCCHLEQPKMVLWQLKPWFSISP